MNYIDPHFVFSIQKILNKLLWIYSILEKKCRNRCSEKMNNNFFSYLGQYTCFIWLIIIRQTHLDTCENSIFDTFVPYYKCIMYKCDRTTGLVCLTTTRFQSTFCFLLPVGFDNINVPKLVLCLLRRGIQRLWPGTFLQNSNCFSGALAAPRWILAASQRIPYASQGILGILVASQRGGGKIG